MRQVNLCRHQYVHLAVFIFFWLNRHLEHVQPGLSLHNAFILQELAGGWKTEEDEVREESDRERRSTGTSELLLLVTPSPLFAAISSPSASIIYFFPMSELWQEIPHMPLICNEAAQEWSYLTTVEFSTLASDMSPEAIKQKEEWGLLSDWRRGQWPSAREIEGCTCFCLLSSVFLWERQDGEITIRGWEVTEG